MSERLEKDNGGYYSESESVLIKELIEKIKKVYTIVIIDVVFSVLCAVVKGLDFFDADWLKYVIAGIAVLLLAVLVIKLIPVFQAYKKCKPIFDKERAERKKNKKK